MNPEDLAGRRWKPVKKKLERRNRLVREVRQASEHLTALQEQLPRAEQADREAFAAALTEGKAEPERGATEIVTAIETEQRRLDAAQLALENEERELRKLCAASGAWRGETLRQIAKARLAYQASIQRLEAEREALGDEVALIGWLARGDTASPVNDVLSGRNTTAADGRPPFSFTQIVAALNEDADEIATHLREPEPRLPWTRIKDHAEALVGQGLSRDEAVQHAAWGDE